MDETLLKNLHSPNVSVNAPRIDKMVEFPLASSGELLVPNRRLSLPSSQSSYTSPNGNRLITKDKCMVQIPCDRGGVQSDHLQYNGSECSDHNNPTGSTHWSSESRQQRFNTSSYRQRAEALEGLLEFSARLLHQERFEELQVLLKPFGPEKVSPRETAIWLSKSFKEHTAWWWVYLINPGWMNRRWHLICWWMILFISRSIKSHWCEVNNTLSLF